jgi:MFS family permease
VLLVFALLVALVPVYSPWLTVAFFAALTLFSLGAGLVSVPFMDVVGKVIPPRRRGAFFGQRMFWGGLVALGGSAIIGFLLSEPGGLRFPLNVAVMFVLASIFYGLTAWSWILIKEPPSPLPATAQQGVVDQVVAQFHRGFQALEENVVYRRYVWVRLALIAAGWAGPFLVVYAQRELGIAAGLLGLYLGVRTAGGILSNLLWGRISDGVGNRKLIIATTAVGAATPILALVFGWLHSSAPASTAWLSYAFALVFLAAGMFGPGSAMGLTNYLLDVAPDEQRPLYLAFTNTLFGLARFMGMLGGLIVDWVGFDVLFGAAAIFYLIAFVGSITLAEPRDRPDQEL